MILSAQSIRARSGMIEPFCKRGVIRGMSYGLSACGYDVRIAEHVRLDRGAFALASTIEHFDLPADVVGMLCDKSTWARRGLSIFNTVSEPGWRGHLTLELVNHGPETLILWPGDPIGQMVFHRLDQPTDLPYSGKYQNQDKGPQSAREEQS
jgi:dCTP deaminase